ncbi:MAG TPA: hypothetical protein VL574_00710 [Stellaceae bacterium]|nr:hypothetical protein [Stellaceae bacterium]
MASTEDAGSRIVGGEVAASALITSLIILQLKKSETPSSDLDLIKGLTAQQIQNANFDPESGLDEAAIKEFAMQFAGRIFSLIGGAK